MEFKKEMLSSNKSDQKPKKIIISEPVNRQKEKSLKDLIEECNPDYVDIYEKRNLITSGESEDFNEFCNKKLKLKTTQIYVSSLTLIYFALSVVSFIKYKSEFYAAAYLICSALNIFVFFFRTQIK